MERPPLNVDSSTDAAIEHFLSLGQPKAGDGLLDMDQIVHAGGGVTPWQFLCTLAERTKLPFTEPAIRTSSPSSRENRSTSHRSVTRRRSLPQPTRFGRCSTRSSIAVATD